MQRTNIFSLVVLTVLTFCSFLVSGCASMFGDNRRIILIESYPSKADVIYKGAEYGQTPINIYINNTINTGQITLVKDGYHTEYVPIHTKYQGVGVMNVLFPIGFLVDTVNGNSMKLAQKKVTTVLSKKQN